MLACHCLCTIAIVAAAHLDCRTIQTNQVAVIRVEGSSEAADTKLRLPKTNQEIDEIEHAGRYVVERTGTGIAILLDKDLPLIRDIQGASNLAAAFEAEGVAKRFDELPMEAQDSAISALGKFGFGGGINSDTKFAMVMEPAFEFKVNGKSVQLALGGPNSSSTFKLASELATSPVVPDASSSSRPIVRHRAGNGIVFDLPPQLHDELARSNLTKRMAELLDRTVQEAVQARDAKFKALLEAWLNRNKESVSDLPGRQTEKQDLSQGLMDRLGDTFASSFAAFGFLNREEAEMAWHSAEFSGAWMRVGLTFGMGRVQGTPSISTVSIATIGKR